MTGGELEKYAVSYAEGVATAVLGKLGQLLSEEYKLLRGVRREVVLLRDDVAIMNSLLRMLAEADESTVNHFVREWMKQVRELAYDAEDDIDFFFVRRISNSHCYPRQWYLRHCLGSDIKDLRARALAISERRKMYDVDKQMLVPSILFAPSTEAIDFGAASANNDPNQLVATTKKVEALSGKVTGQTNQDPQPSRQDDSKLKVFSIVGFAGVGKTTLAKEVCRSLNNQFDGQAIVPVSQAFDVSKDMRRLIKGILEKVATVQERESMAHEPPMDLADLTTRLGSILAGKRYLIVIDDVWTIQAWEAIRARLPENNKSSRVIVTTRRESVAKACVQANPEYYIHEVLQANPEYYIHKVQPLEREDAKSLFKTRYSGDESCWEKILERCGGIPLAIISIAGLVSSYKSPDGQDKLDTFWKSMGSQMESNPTLERMTQLITLSYNHLPHHLRACMMYLSIFPEDYEISKGRLLNRWIAEGLIPEKRGLTSLEVAEGFADELVSRNLIEPVSNAGTVKHYHVHDVMLEVIVSKSLEENFVRLVGGLGGGTSSCDRVRRLSIQGDDPRSNVLQQMDMGHVRSLTTFRLEGHSKVLDRLKEFTLLRVLDLEDCKELKDHHMKQVCQLFLLRFLNLNDTDIKELPSQIGDLLHLQTLWLYHTLLKKLPGSVTKLENLENLTFRHRGQDGWQYRIKLPQGLRRMKCLTGLIGLELQKEDAEIAKEIGDLRQLLKLHIVLNFKYESNNIDRLVLEKLGKSISSIHYSLRDFSVEDLRDDADNMTFLHDLSPEPLLLRHLIIGGKINELPRWVQSLTHLTEITLWWINLRSDEIFGVLCKAPNLLKIVLDRKCCSEELLVAKSDYKFEKLTELQVVPYGDRVQHTPTVIEFHEGSMVNLDHLTVRFGTILEGMRNLTKLRHRHQIHGTTDGNNRELHTEVKLQQWGDEGVGRELRGPDDKEPPQQWGDEGVGRELRGPDEEEPLQQWGDEGVGAVTVVKK